MSGVLQNPLSSQQHPVKTFGLINNLNFTKSLQPLSCCFLVADLAVVYRSFYRNLSLILLKSHSHRHKHHIVTAFLSNRSSTNSYPISYHPKNVHLMEQLTFFFFPESYKLSSFKSKINKLDFISLSSLLSLSSFSIVRALYRALWLFPNIAH